MRILTLRVVDTYQVCIDVIEYAYTYPQNMRILTRRICVYLPAEYAYTYIEYAYTYPQGVTDSMLFEAWILLQKRHLIDGPYRGEAPVYGECVHVCMYDACVCVCIYVYMCVCVCYVCIRLVCITGKHLCMVSVCMYVREYACLYICISIYAYVCMCVCMYVYICYLCEKRNCYMISVCMYVCMYVCIHVVHIEEKHLCMVSACMYVREYDACVCMCVYMYVSRCMRMYV